VPYGELGIEKQLRYGGILGYHVLRGHANHYHQEEFVIYKELNNSYGWMVRGMKIY
jgi:hypothetical protein